MPFWFATITSNLQPTDVQRRIDAVVQSKRGISDTLSAVGDPVPTERPFRGIAQEGYFKVMRIIRYKNSFLPVVFVRVQPGTFGGTIVRIRMRLHLAVTAFMIFWFGVPAWSDFKLFRSATPNTTSPDLASLGMLALGILLVAGGFFPEALKAQRLIRNALNAEAPRPQVVPSSARV